MSCPADPMGHQYGPLGGGNFGCVKCGMITRPASGRKIQ